VTKLQPPPPPAPTSLAEALAREPKDPAPVDAGQLREVRELAARRQTLAQTAKPDPDEVKKVDAAAGALLKKFDGKPLELARLVFAAALEEPVGQAALRFLSDLLQQANIPAYSETRYLTRLTELPVTSSDDWPAESVWTALQVVRDAARVANGDARAQPWVAELRVTAERQRRGGEDLLWGAAARRPGARSSLEEALKGCQAVLRDLRTVEDAQRLADEVGVLLPGYAPYLEVDAAPTEAWLNAMASATRLREVLAAEPAKGDARDEQIRRMANCVRELRSDPNNLNSLREGLDPERLKRLIGRSDLANLADAKVITAWLETTWPEPAQRVALWSARCKFAAALRERPDAGETPAEDEKRATAAEEQRGLRRARVSVALLHMQGAEGLEKLDGALRQAEGAPADTSRRNSLADELRRAWDRWGSRTDKP
jgi:hypothetical protein